jgi:hypothetical protein
MIIETNRNINEDCKTCSKCHGVKPIVEFNFRHREAGIRHSYCRDCGKDLTRSHYKQNKRLYLDRNNFTYEKHRGIVRQAKSRPCADCGVQYPFYVMDFDHRDGATKSFALNSVRRKTIKAILLEIEKCDVVCSNCHRERTYKRLMQRESVI